MKKALITGATGLVGSHLMVELIRNSSYEVTAMARSEESMKKLREILDRYNIKDPKYILVDTTDFEVVKQAISEFDIIFHCAAIVSFDEEMSEQMVSNNVELTYYVVDSCLASEKKPLLVHVSSIAALGHESYPKLTTEQTPFSNIGIASPYARSKFLSENEVWRGVKFGLNAVIVCPSVILGKSVGSNGLQVALEMAFGGISIYPTGVNGYVDVVDVARAMYLLSEKPKSWGHRYILSAYNLTYKDFINGLNKAFGHKPARIKVSKKVLNIAVRLLRKLQKSPKITLNMVEYLTSKVAYDGSRITEAVAFKYTPFEETLNRIASEYEKPAKS